MDKDANEDSFTKQRTRMENWYEGDLQKLFQAIELCPVETWDLLMSHVLRLTMFEAPFYDPEFTKWHKEWISHGYIGIERGVVELIIKSGQKLAKENPESLVERTKTIENCSLRIVQEILIEIYYCLPKEYSNIGIRWLLNDFSRLRLGDGYHEPEWGLPLG